MAVPVVATPPAQPAPEIPPAVPTPDPGQPVPSAVETSLRQQLQEAQTQIGKQSTEIGELRKQSPTVPQGIVAPLAPAAPAAVVPPAEPAPLPGQPVVPAPQAEPITVAERSFLEERWKNLQANERAELLKGATGATNSEKLSAVRSQMLAVYRENMVTVPESLFGDSDPPADPAASGPPKDTEAYRQVLLQAVLGADKVRTRMPVRQPGASSGGPQSVPIAPSSFHGRQDGEDQVRLQRTGGGLPIPIAQTS